MPPPLIKVLLLALLLTSINSPRIRAGNAVTGQSSDAQPAPPPQPFFPLADVRPGLRGIGRTVFQGNRIDEFQVEILGVLENLTPKQTIILAKLSGGPLAETGIMQGMSGSPVYIDGKLLGAVALGFPYSKEPIAGITPIQQMIADVAVPARADLPVGEGPRRLHSPADIPISSNFPSPFGNLTEILTPVALSGFTPRTLQSFASNFHTLGFEPQQGVSAGTPPSQQYSGTVSPGSMISVELLSGDMNITADGTVTYVDGKHMYALGHRFLDIGSTEMPFARADVIALLPTINTSFKISMPREWVGTIVDDRSSSILGEIGRRARTIPLVISVRSPEMGAHAYHFQVVNDRLLTPFITQTAIFSAIDATERTLGAGTLHLQGRVEFQGDVPPLIIRDIFVSDSGLAQQVSADAVVSLGFVLGAGFANLHIKQISFDLEPLEIKRQLRVAQAWASSHESHPGDSVEITALLEGENGIEVTRTASYRIPAGAVTGAINFTITDANGLNFPEFAGLSSSSAHTPTQLIQFINAFRGSEAVYVRVWRQEPSFTIAGPLPGGDLSDPPPSVMLVLADPAASANSNAALTLTRGSELAEFKLPVEGYVVSGSKTVQVDVKE
ncbi:MAG: SpoIVB peptidase S55 domain-containing protein [Bryobacteraceae bacterium]